MGARVVVAMSGGVDSAIAAARCVDAGYDVIGISLRLADGGSGSCCSLDDFQDAAAVADRLGFPHYVFDFRASFDRDVVQPFVREYLAGRTPNPCARCNQHIKFDALWEHARELGAHRLATGHYARITRRGPSAPPMLRRAADPEKDQSYFLFMLSKQALERTLFPIGDLTKEAVRDDARRRGLPVADKPESMDICFVPRTGAAMFVEDRAPRGALRPGTIEAEDGTVLGTHAGVHRFTVGQRRGLGIAGTERRYVRRIDAQSGTIVVTPEQGLRARGLRATEVCWTTGRPPVPNTPLTVRIRHRHPLLPCRVVRAVGRDCEIRFDTNGPAVTPGQAAVFYDDDVVLGGGWIVEEVA